MENPAIGCVYVTETYERHFSQKLQSYSLVQHPVARKDQYSTNKPPVATNSLSSVFIFLLSHTTCFGLHAGHHQVLINKITDPWFVILLINT
jgi:hypothetical protein